MDTIELNTASVNAYKTIMEGPLAYGFDFRPLSECFEPSEVATPKHILFKEYVEYIQKPLPKVMFYIVMDGLYPVVKASSGEFGYKLKFKPEAETKK